MNYRTTIVIIYFITTALSVYPITDSIKVLKNDLIVAKKQEKDISQTLNSILNLYNSQYSSNSHEYADCLMWCAMMCAEANDNKLAHQLLTESIKTFKHYGYGSFNGLDTINYIFKFDILSKMATNHNAQLIALRFAKKAYQYKPILWGVEDHKNLKSLLDLSQSYAERQRYVRSQMYHSQAYNAYVNLIEKELCSLSESERRSYWSVASQYIYKTLNVAHTYSKQKLFNIGNQITSDAYDAALLSKGILLNTTRNFEDFVLNSNNLTALEELSKRKLLSAKGADQAILDSLDYIILGELKSNNQAYTIPHLSQTWQDIARELNDKDIAIEFFRTFHKEYGALYIKKSWKYPRIIDLKDLSTSDDLWLCNRLLQEASTDSTNIYKELRQITRDVWPYELTKHFPKKGDGNVYFSVDGDLQIASIEYLPTCAYHHVRNHQKHTPCMSDVYSLHRLSSTRELLKKHQNETTSSIVGAIYGGLSYAMDTASMSENQKKYTSTLPSKTRNYVAHNDLSLDSLEGSKKEAEMIYHLIKGLDKQTKYVTPYIGKDGTEASFKALGGKHNNIIHIATHGFFEEDLVDTNDQYIDPMIQSGLLMSGANHKLFNETLPIGVDDGILTALEISSIDFRGLDLITLSACETGLGKIELDGIFGLQRGFKMADANSILMSLWKVDDEATCALMIEFYKNYFTGKSKHEALQCAIDYIRKDKRWSSPKYWAAFILLDGINDIAPESISNPQ